MVFAGYVDVECSLLLARRLTHPVKDDTMLNDRIAPKTARRLSSPDSVPIAEQAFHEAAIAFAKMLVHNPYSPRMEGMIKLFEQKYERLETAIAFERADDAAASPKKK